MYRLAKKSEKSSHSRAIACDCQNTSQGAVLPKHGRPNIHPRITQNFLLRLPDSLGTPWETYKKPSQGSMRLQRHRSSQKQVSFFERNLCDGLSGCLVWTKELHSSFPVARNMPAKARAWTREWIASLLPVLHMTPRVETYAYAGAALWGPGHMSWTWLFQGVADQYSDTLNRPTSWSLSPAR